MCEDLVVVFPRICSLVGVVVLPPGGAPPRSFPVASISVVELSATLATPPNPKYGSVVLRKANFVNPTTDFHKFYNFP